MTEVDLPFRVEVVLVVRTSHIHHHVVVQVVVEAVLVCNCWPQVQVVVLVGGAHRG